MTERTIRSRQSEYDDVAQLQSYIDSGLVWRLEGHMGREAMRALESGACFLPKERHTDFWGNLVPGRTDLKRGTKGTLENSSRFWSDQDHEQRPINV